MENEISYSGIHKWLFYNYGKAGKCESNCCKNKTPKRFEWALLKGLKYEKKRDNFIMLCASCHRKYDMTRDMMAGMFKYNNDNKIKVGQYSKNGDFIKEWESLTSASESLSLKKSHISYCIKNKPKYKTCGGFIWKKL